MPLVPVAVGAAVFFGLLRPGRTVREAALLALTVVMTAVVALTEGLSAVGAITPVALSLAWLTVLGAALAWCWRGIRPGLAHLRASVPAPDRADRAVAVTLAVFLGGTVLSALLYPVVNYDSLTAHMPRVFFWLQNGSVEHYPTPFGPQLFSGTTTAYVVLHLKALAGGSDRLVNLAGWLAYVFAVMTVSLIAMRLGARRRGQQVAALVAAATPMALLQASTTQTDITTALWCLAAVYGVLRFPDTASSTLRDQALWALYTGAALGLATGAKASAYLVLAPFFLWLTLIAVKRAGARRALTLAAVVLISAIVLNAGTYLRNVRTLDGDIIGSSAPGMSHILVQDRSIGALATTALKNVSMLIGTPSERVNTVVASGVSGIVTVLGGDVDSGSNAEEASGSYRLDARITNHDVGPAPVIVLLVTVSTAFVLGSRRTRTLVTAAYLGCALAALALTAGLVSWNLFVNRILVAPLLLLMPVAGLAFDGSCRTARATLAALTAVAIAWGGGVMALNSTNRLVPPPASLGMRDLGWWNASYDDLRFRVLAPEMEGPTRRVVAALDTAGVSRVGIDDRVSHAPVYCLLAELGDRQVGYVGETVLPDRIENGGFTPEAIIEILPADAYPAALADGTPRGPLLVEPQDAGRYYVLLLYEVP